MARKIISEFADRSKKQNRTSTNSQETILENVTWITGIPEGDERENGTEQIFDVITVENFPKLMTKQTTHPKDQRTLGTINSK